MLTVLSIAYALAPVGPDAVGGAEQVLGAIDRALVRGGHRSIVIACEGSESAGQLVAVPQPAADFDEPAINAARGRHRRAMRDVLSRARVDVVHLHGIDFGAYLPILHVPVLATLHCPPDWYAGLAPAEANVWTHGVSLTQHRDLPASPRLLPPIENGVAVEDLPRARKRRFALMLGRLAPEKGIHHAITAARSAGTPLLIAGQLFPYAEHRRYFTEQVAPMLDRARRWIGPVGGARKQNLLAAARCVIVSSTVAETSSLVAREALAAGTPVVAFRNGALAETIEHGRTGFLVDTVDEMAEAIGKVDGIDPAICRQVARERFSLDRMTGEYLARYRMLTGKA